MQVIWTAPETGSGCIVFRATIIENRDSWYMDEGVLTQELCEDEDAQKDFISNVLEQCCACNEAKYEVCTEWGKKLSAAHFTDLFIRVVLFSCHSKVSGQSIHIRRISRVTFTQPSSVILLVRHIKLEMGMSIVRDSSLMSEKKTPIEHLSFEILFWNQVFGRMVRRPRMAWKRWPKRDQLDHLRPSSKTRSDWVLFASICLQNTAGDILTHIFSIFFQCDQIPTER